MGKVRSRGIACPYHGWEWSATDGTCLRVPALGEGGRPPAGARIPAYRTREKWGLVWTCLAEPLGDLPAFPELEEYDLTWMNSEEIPQNCGIAAATENFRDVAHFPFVHYETMGEMPEEVAPLVVRRDGHECWTSTRYEAKHGSEEVFSSEGAITLYYHTVAPSFSCILFDYEGVGKRVLLNTVQPTGPGGQGCIVRFVVAIDSEWRGETLEECLSAETAVYLEDKPIVNNLMPLEVRFGERIEYSTIADRYTATYRACFLDFINDALTSDALVSDETPAAVAEGSAAESHV